MDKEAAGFSAFPLSISCPGRARRREKLLLKEKEGSGAGSPMAVFLFGLKTTTIWNKRRRFPVQKIQKAPETMTSKERVLRTFSFQETDRVPIDYMANPASTNDSAEPWASPPMTRRAWNSCWGWTIELAGPPL